MSGEQQGRMAVEQAVARLGPVLGFMRLVWAVDHGLTLTSARMRQARGVTAPQRLVIRIVGRIPGISAGELAEVLHVRPATLTPVLRRLTGTGLLRRDADPGDARRALFTLTPAGRAIDKWREGTVESVVHEALARISAADRAAAERVLVELARRLDPESAPATGRAKRRGR